MDSVLWLFVALMAGLYLALIRSIGKLDKYVQAERQLAAIAKEEANNTSGDNRLLLLRLASLHAEAAEVLSDVYGDRGNVRLAQLHTLIEEHTFKLLVLAEKQENWEHGYFVRGRQVWGKL